MSVLLGSSGFMTAVLSDPLMRAAQDAGAPVDEAAEIPAEAALTCEEQDASNIGVVRNPGKSSNEIGDSFAEITQGQTMCGRPVDSYVFSAINRRTVFVQFTPLYNQLSACDRQRLHRIITSTGIIRGRSTDFLLSKTFKHDGEEIVRLRCKGISPRLNSDMVLMPHLGRGCVQYPMEISAGGEAYLDIPTFAPEGACGERDLLREIAAAKRLGFRLTDAVICYGYYRGLRFGAQSEEKIGFIIYGSRVRNEMRVFSGYLQTSIRCLRWGISEEDRSGTLAAIFEGMGRAIFSMHQRGLVHKYPHLENFSVLYNHGHRVLICDLETAEELSSMTPEQRFGYVLLDLGKIARDIAVCFCENGDFRRPSRIASYLVGHFSKGYFGHERSDTSGLLCLPEFIFALREGSAESIPLLSWASGHEKHAVRDVARLIAASLR